MGGKAKNNVFTNKFNLLFYKRSVDDWREIKKYKTNDCLNEIHNFSEQLIIKMRKIKLNYISTGAPLILNFNEF